MAKMVEYYLGNPH